MHPLSPRAARHYGRPVCVCCNTRGRPGRVRERCRRAFGDGRGRTPHRIGGRRRDRNPLCPRARKPRHRSRHHQPLSGAGACRQAERRLHAAIVGRRCARARALAGAGGRRLGAEGDDIGARSRARALRARARPLHRRGHHREDPIDRASDRRGRARRVPRQDGGDRSRRARHVAQAHRAAAQGAVRPVVHQWAADGGRPCDCRRRHHHDCRRRQRDHRVRRLQAGQR